MQPFQQTGYIVSPQLVAQTPYQQPGYGSPQAVPQQQQGLGGQHAQPVTYNPYEQPQFAPPLSGTPGTSNRYSYPMQSPQNLQPHSQQQQQPLPQLQHQPVPQQQRQPSVRWTLPATASSFMTAAFPNAEEQKKRRRVQFAKKIAFYFSMAISVMIVGYIAAAWWNSQIDYSAKDYFKVKGAPRGTVGCAKDALIDATKYAVLSRPGQTTLAGFGSCFFVPYCNGTNSLLALQQYVRTCKPVQAEFLTKSREQYHTIKDFPYNFFKDAFPAMVPIGIAEMISAALTFYLYLMCLKDPLYSSAFVTVIKITLNVLILSLGLVSTLAILFFSSTNFCTHANLFASPSVDPCTLLNKPWTKADSENELLGPRSFIHLLIGLLSSLSILCKWIATFVNAWDIRCVLKYKRELNAIRPQDKDHFTKFDRIMCRFLCVRPK
jgi:hypothetical protein